MGVSNLTAVLTETGVRARTRRLMLATAIDLMQAGKTPSVSDVAEAAGVSRATAYRYFPSQSALVMAVVDEALGPILSWQSDSNDPSARIKDLLVTSLPRIIEFEATFKASVKLTLEQWAERRAGHGNREPPFKRGHRVEILQRAIEPLRDVLPEYAFMRLAKALSLAYGLEVLMVLKDLWGLEFDEMQDVAVWAATAMVKAALEEAKATEP